MPSARAKVGEIFSFLFLVGYYFFGSGIVSNGCIYLRDAHGVILKSTKKFRAIDKDCRQNLN